ncbi:MAG TPA: hypothetical protein PKD64_07090 [Pirellulaceae bacterium]|nr:hypothetical protein [Pirellulaceae bacterium]HMO91949.1 hypothetical protein [Pirellulaceae bacterium]HMP68748.1 hypothetical protein [Pirellulaceae bacterium]
MTIEPLEQRVLDSLTELYSSYRVMHTLIDEMMQHENDSHLLDSLTIKVKQQNDVILRLEQTTREIKEDYRARVPHASERIRQASADLAEYLKTIMMKVNQLEERARASRTELIPQIQQGVKAVQMKNAYEKYA